MLRQQTPLKTDPVATKEHCHFCFEALVAHLQGDPAPEPTFEDAFCPLFVTWNKRSSSGNSQHLRGCIGTLEPRCMHTALKDYALTSALRDSRFSPISLHELPRLCVSVSLLRHFEAADHATDWAVGRHGIIMEFTDPILKCRRSATFLPEVCAEQGWTKTECIDALVKKAGYSGTVTDALRETLRVTRYQSTKAALPYAEYMQRRAGHDAALARGGSGAEQIASGSGATAMALA